MQKITRREFGISASAAVVAASTKSFSAAPAGAGLQRVFVASGTENGILAYDWNPASAELTAVGVAATAPKVAWLSLSRDEKYIYAACEVDSFQGLPTGGVMSFRLHDGKLEKLSEQNAAGIGTCYVGIDATGHVAIAVDYMGGSAASYRITDGQLSTPVWNIRYKEHGPNHVRQQNAHPHFVAFSPDNKYAYINDLGGDVIHIYALDTKTAELTLRGQYKSRAGAGPRTLHFHPNRYTAYSVNELDSTVDVLKWSKSDGSLKLVTRIELLPADYHGPTRACDTVITKDGRFVYFANRDNDFLYSFRADAQTGALVPIGRSNCGGKRPRNFTLDPTEKWMLVANQDSNCISVFARNPVTGVLADEGKEFDAAVPMRILFV